MGIWRRRPALAGRVMPVTCSTQSSPYRWPSRACEITSAGHELGEGDALLSRLCRFPGWVIQLEAVDTFIKRFYFDCESWLN